MRLSSRQQRPRQAYRRGCAGAGRESTAVSQLFEGQMSYTSVCMHCDQQTRSTQAFTVLSLPIPTEPMKCSIQVQLRAAGTLCPSVCRCLLHTSSHSVSVSVRVCAAQDCLSLFFEQTILTGGEQLLCSVCGLRRETTIFTSLDQPPEILTLHLKRSVKYSSNIFFSTNVRFFF